MNCDTDFSEKLREIELSFETFIHQFQSGEASDFSPVHHRVSALLTDTEKTKLSPENRDRLQLLGEKLAKITQDVQREMKVLQVDMSKNNHRSYGLKAYTRQKIIGEN